MRVELEWGGVRAAALSIPFLSAMIFITFRSRMKLDLVVRTRKDVCGPNISRKDRSEMCFQALRAGVEENSDGSKSLNFLWNGRPVCRKAFEFTFGFGDSAMKRKLRLMKVERVHHRHCGHSLLCAADGSSRAHFQEIRGTLCSAEDGTQEANHRVMAHHVHQGHCHAHATQSKDRAQ